LNKRRVAENAEFQDEHFLCALSASTFQNCTLDLAEKLDS